MRLYSMEFAELFVDYQDALEPTKENFKKALPIAHAIHKLVCEMDEKIDKLESRILHLEGFNEMGH